MARLHSLIPGTRALWQLQDDFLDSSGNALHFANVGGISNLPVAPLPFVTLDACLVGVDTTGPGLDSDTKLMAPLSSLLQLAGPKTIQWLMIQHHTYTWPYFTCGDPTSSRGGPSSIGSLYTFWTDSGNPGVSDQHIGSNLPSPGYGDFPGYDDHVLFNWADVGNPIGVFHLHHFTYTDDGSGNYQVYRDGVTAGAGVLSAGVNVATGLERFFVAGIEKKGAGGGIMASIRVLDYARAPADILADAVNGLTVSCEGTVIRAFAIDGQTIRVVFPVAPVFRSSAGIFDALNPANYAFSIDVGDARNPVATTVSSILVVGPARYVGNGGNVGERGVDVHVDRPVVEGVTYRVTVTNVMTAGGAPMGPSNNRAFGGIVAILQRPRSQRGKPTTNVDVANDVSRGSWFGDDSGDVAAQDALSGYRKRVFRRLTTPKNAFSFLKGYGLGQQLKGLSSSARVAALKTDAEQQIMLEPETAKVSVNTSISPLGILTFSVRAWTRVGAFTEMSVQVAPDGAAALVQTP